MILFHFHTETSRFFLLSVNTQTHTYLLQFKQVILSSVLVKRWRPWQVHWLFSLLFWIYSLLIHIFSDCFLPEKCVSTFHYDRGCFLLSLFLDPVYLTCQFSQSALFCAVYIQFLPPFWQVIFISYFPEIIRLSEISTLNISLSLSLFSPTKKKKRHLHHPIL